MSHTELLVAAIMADRRRQFAEVARRRELRGSDGAEAARADATATTALPIPRATVRPSTGANRAG
jgi:hypothetical protein